MKLTRKLVLFSTACAFGLSNAAHATEWEDNRNVTLGGDSGVSGNVVDVPENDSAIIRPQLDNNTSRPVSYQVSVPRDRVQDYIDQMESRPAVAAEVSRGDMDDREREASTGRDSRSRDSDSGDSRSRGNNTGGEGISNADIESKVNSAVSGDNEEFKTVLDYFGAYMDGAQYHWGGPINQVGAGGDCSGLMSQLVRILVGENPWSRIFTTHGQTVLVTDYGFENTSGPHEPGTLHMGWNGGHTAGTLPSGVKIESGGGCSESGRTGSLNTYGRDCTAGGDDAQFSSFAALPWDKIDEKMHWDAGVAEWEDYLDGVSWEPWISCAEQGASGPINPCAGITDSVNEENGWSDKITDFPGA